MQVRRQAVLQARPRLALLEHQLPGPGHGRRAGRRRVAGRPATRALLRAARPRPHVLPADRDRRAARSPTATASRPRPRTPSPIDLTADGPVVPFASVVTAARGAGALAATSSDVARWARALYAGGVLEPDDGPGDARRRQPDRALPADRALRPGRPADRDRRRAGASATPAGCSASARRCAACPTSGMTIAVLTNQSRTDPAIVLRALLKIALQPQPRVRLPRPALTSARPSRGASAHHFSSSRDERRRRPVRTGLDASARAAEADRPFEGGSHADPRRGVHRVGGGREGSWPARDISGTSWRPGATSRSSAPRWQAHRQPDAQRPPARWTCPSTTCSWPSATMTRPSRSTPPGTDPRSSCRRTC